MARDYYTKLEARYPFGSYAQQAQIDLAYVNYKDDDAAGAILQLDRFLRAYPNHPNSDYALYLKALATLNERDGWLAELTTQDLADRDAQAYIAAINRAKVVISDFQTTAARDDALVLIADCYHELGMYDLEKDTRRVIELNKIKPKAEEDDSWLPSLW